MSEGLVLQLRNFQFPRAMVERGADKIEGPMQFVREGYFTRDGRRGDNTYHQIVGLKSSKDL